MRDDRAEFSCAPAGMNCLLILLHLDWNGEPKNQWQAIEANQGSGKAMIFSTTSSTSVAELTSISSISAFSSVVSDNSNADMHSLSACHFPRKSCRRTRLCSSCISNPPGLNIIAVGERQQIAAWAVRVPLDGDSSGSSIALPLQFESAICRPRGANRQLASHRPRSR